MYKEPFQLILGAAVLGGLIGVVATQVLIAQPVSAQATPPGRTVQAEKFEVVDQTGKVRMQIGLTEQGDPSITLLDDARRPLVQIAAGRAGAGLIIGNRDQPTLALLGVDDRGAPNLILNNPNGTKHASLGVQANTGKAFLQLFTQDGTPQVSLIAHEDKGEIMTSPSSKP
jgi:hypothetical protein